ncbi:hypothetical protein ACIQWN_32190 [Streptomyces vinaceus]|uniref:hypothetical protein n=1 Tax=Streptomyces vinaceus TaxID=1960 RepID=UPI00380EDC59
MSRSEYIEGLRSFADWLEANPEVDAPVDERMLLVLHTNPAVEEFAAEHGLDVAYDREGNASADMAFGPVVFHAYGYVDFASHVEAADELQARSWATKRGLKITEAVGVAS